MFKKLVANLPFSPSLISQVGFYSNRLKRERFIRQLSFVFISLTMVIQIVAVAVPPERSLASSPNNIINGLRTKDDILSAWDQPNSDIPKIYELFGVTRTDIEALPTYPNASLKSTDADYWSIGRNSLSGYSGVDQEYKNSQVSLQYGGTDTTKTSDDQYIYQRALKAWDIQNPSSTYKAFRGTIASTGEPFWILLDCGNLTKIGRYTPPPTPEIPDPKPPTPKIEIKKSIVDTPTSLNPGDTYTYRIEYRNRIKNSLAENVVIKDQLNTKYFNVVSPTNLSITNGFLKYDVGDLPYTPNYKVLTIKVRLKDQISSGTNVCNSARIISTNTTADASDEACVGIIKPCQYNLSIADSNDPNCIEPKLVCTVVDIAVNRSTRQVTYKTIVTSTNPANTEVKKYAYDFGDDVVETFTSSDLTNQAKHTYKPGEYVAQATVYFRTTGQSEGKDKKIACSAPVNFDEDQPLGQSKVVKNITQEKEGESAISTIVQGNDRLEYSLSTTNSQNYDRTDIEISDYVGDILDYAVIDLEYLKEQDASFDETTNKITWLNLTIPASSSIVKSFRVKIKSPIPSTNSPTSVSTNFDCRISNEYGNEITMNINCPLVKGLETLPNTGPGSSLAMISGITVVVGYFFARSRLLAKEIAIVRRDYVATGGV